MSISLILIIISLMIFYFIQEEKNKSVDDQMLLSSCRQLKPNQLITQTLLTEYKLSKDFNWKLHITCKDDYEDGSIRKLKINNRHQRIMGISGRWTLGSKVKLWKTLVNYYGRQQASKIMPRTYLFPVDWNLFNKEYNPQKAYFIKKDIERQKGLQVATKLNEIKTAVNDDKFVLAQEYLRNPYLYRGHKINLRAYLLLVSNGTYSKQAYLFNDGLVSYTGLPYQDPLKNNSQLDQMMASFYQSAELYRQGYPIIWSEFSQRELNSYQTSQVWSEIKSLTSKVLDATHHLMGKYQFMRDNTSFELFGLDIFLSGQLKPWLVEINVGPGMSPNNDRDDLMRRKIYQDMFNRVGVLKNDKENDFELFWSK